MKFDATNESPEGHSPKIGVTQEFHDSFTRLKAYLLQAHGAKGADERLAVLSEHFQETMDDFAFVERLTAGKLADLSGDWLNNVSFKS